jgi:hypothetical protein
MHEYDLQLLMGKPVPKVLTYIMSVRGYIRSRATDNATALHCIQLLSLVLSAFMDSVQVATDSSGVAMGLRLGWQILI